MYLLKKNKKESKTCIKHKNMRLLIQKIISNFFKKKYLKSVLDESSVYPKPQRPRMDLGRAVALPNLRLPKI